MQQSVAWRVGGQQGEGIESTGDILTSVLTKLGYYTYGYKVFSSRIKGGHTSFTVRVSDRPLYAPAANVNLLIALDQETINLCAGELASGSVVVADEAFKPVLPEDCKAVLIPIELSKTARTLGNILMRNMVALGATAKLFGLELTGFNQYAADKFGSKGDKVVQGNLQGLQVGYEAVPEQFATEKTIRLPVADGKARLVVTGNQATALGAAAAGCRMMAGYPITPASEIMEYLMAWLPRLGGVVVQMEDELASISAAIAAGFAGARSMTATSGPGISLMQEALGLAAITETPVVVVDTQRGGPSTGMPTKHEQSDLFALVYGGHGDSQRIVLAPGTAKQVFDDMILAFNLAEIYQNPVMVASDLSLALWKQTVDENEIDPTKATIDRGSVVDAEELIRLGRDAYQRYAFTANNISPRSIPGMKNGQFLATGAEHGTGGKVTENPANRVKMMNKRAHKLDPINTQHAGVEYRGAKEPELVLVSYGATIGSVWEAAEILAERSLKVGAVQVRRLAPFPTEELAGYLAPAQVVMVVENNFAGQLMKIMRMEGIEAALRYKLPVWRSLLKFDGTLFIPDEVAAAGQEAIAENRSAAQGQRAGD